MKRREFLRLSVLAGIALTGCKNSPQTSTTGSKHYLEAKTGKTITLEGEILHVCPVEGLKMKLKLADGEIIRVVYPDNLPIEPEWNHKEVRITGKLESMKLSRKQIDSNYQDKKLLCHIDHSPCIDKKWIDNRWKDGSAQRLLDKDNNALQLRMRNNKSNAIQVFTIVAEKVELITS